MFFEIDSDDNISTLFEFDDLDTNDHDFLSKPPEKSNYTGN